MIDILDKLPINTPVADVYLAASVDAPSRCGTGVALAAGSCGYFTAS